MGRRKISRWPRDERRKDGNTERRKEQKTNKTSYTDTNKASTLSRDAKAYFTSHHQKTQVKTASLISPEEVMHHAGVDSITLFPPIIRALAAAPKGSMPEGEVGQFMVPPAVSPVDEWKVYEGAVEGKESWEEGLGKSDGGENARKLREAIAAFTKAQDDLEELVRVVAV